MKNLRLLVNCPRAVLGVLAIACGTVYAEDIAAPTGKIVIPRMVSGQFALNAAHGGQITLITSNGYLQGPAVSMAQIVSNHLGALTNLPAFAQGQGITNLAASGNRPPGSSGLPVAPGVVTGLATLPAGPISLGGTPQISVGSQLNWQSFNIGAGSVSQFIPLNAGGVAINLTRSSPIIPITGAGIVQLNTGVGTLVSNGQITTLSPNGLITGAGIVQLNTGALTLPPAGGIRITSGTGTIGGGTAITGAGSRPPTGITLR